MDWNDISLLSRVTTSLTELGFEIKPAKYGQSSVGVYPLDDKNPLYSRDAEVFSGTIEQIACWIRGVEHRDGYLKMLKATTDKRIKDLEEKYVKKLMHQTMLDIIRDPDKKTNKHVQDLINMNSK